MNFIMKNQKMPLLLFLGLLLNVAIAPGVYAASNGDLNRSNAYAIGLLGIVIFGLAIYLALVIMQPEKF
ncbi:MAG: potassium-transporting ATPase subunit F [Gomphosphaeria aponina SAG 52.96 = DSM 107014]|uniref:Potassium-transporting ATPase subunit F n=1 Tax=Gomphosphaeria aponina SAG 52.96 = DSM 107014 TaxID=1521640 RepID=A0A941JMP1_9CHRO|nr:potassium-transporting ATPase subunit F [Gomphosphaeria aponina SAG 52.96 = DSM 107014]